MSNRLASPGPANPLTLWVDLAVKTQEMLWSSGSVIQMRTERMARAGLTPDAVDMAEFQLMGQEKLAAASESGMAVATTQFALSTRAAQHWMASVTAFFAMATSVTPAQAAERSDEFMEAATLSVASSGDLGNAPVFAAHDALAPIHAKATSNARRLSGLRKA
ncbi:MAG: hypothetical protein EOP81_08430 [Variovorax sp.]|nr:MAG: hypothetical protein EOP81_08430 [Variovorax sp.]